MKNELRNKYLNIRNNLKRLEIDQKSKLISEKILNLDILNDYENVLIYSSINSEVDTKYLIEELLKTKNVYLPKTLNNSKMNFLKINSLQNLKKGKYNILEPKDGKKYENEKALVIVPGLVFSKNRYRIGYGGGYYDKFIEKNKQNLYLGICFDFQIVDFLELNEYDQKVDIIITESFAY